MESIQLQGVNDEIMHRLAAQLAADLQASGLGGDLHVGPVTAVSQSEPTRGDPVTLLTIAITAVGAGGAISVLLGKDGFLSALARVLEKYVEGRQGEITIKTKSGDTLHLKGPLGEIKAILKQARE